MSLLCVIGLELIIQMNTDISKNLDKPNPDSKGFIFPKTKTQSSPRLPV